MHPRVKSKKDSISSLLTSRLSTITMKMLILVIVWLWTSLLILLKKNFLRDTCQLKWTKVSKNLNWSNLRDLLFNLIEFPNLLIGMQLVKFLFLRTKETVAHAGLSLQLQLLKVLMLLKTIWMRFLHILCNTWLTVMVETSAVVAAGCLMHTILQNLKELLTGVTILLAILADPKIAVLSVEWLASTTEVVRKKTLSLTNAWSSWLLNNLLVLLSIQTPNVSTSMKVASWLKMIVIALIQTKPKSTTLWLSSATANLMRLAVMSTGSSRTLGDLHGVSKASLDSAWMRLLKLKM